MKGKVIAATAGIFSAVLAGPAIQSVLDPPGTPGARKSAIMRFFAAAGFRIGSDRNFTGKNGLPSSANTSSFTGTAKVMDYEKE
jgi:hypothetical protein